MSKYDIIYLNQYISILFSIYKIEIKQYKYLNVLIYLIQTMNASTISQIQSQSQMSQQEILFSQNKLTKLEWDSIENPESEKEKKILQLIIDGFHNVNISVNESLSMFTYLKIQPSEPLEIYLYDSFLEPIISGLAKKYRAPFLNLNLKTKITIKTADKIRIEKTTIEKLQTAKIYELILIDHIEQILKHHLVQDSKWMFHYFTLYKLKKNNILFINSHVMRIVNLVISHFEEEVNLSQIIENSQTYIEKNVCLLEHSDVTLYDHQKQIYSISKHPNPKLILYIAPTGTGKTLTPLGLSEQHKIIFVCAARHVGLALGRAAVSMNKKIAFAFGCSSAENIRLHYFSAKEYTKNHRTGGIFKVDNSVGDKVEIMICDIRSYIPAMLYMLAFNMRQDIITYWDEPTITMDYEEHDFHEIIQRNWNENLIPNVVLSSATLPKIHEIPDTIADFKFKFPNSRVYNIVSHDCRKTIPLINSFGFVEMPHYMSNYYDEILEIANHCKDYSTLLRYLDLAEISKFISYMEKNTHVGFKIVHHFECVNDINISSIKLYYLKLLQSINPHAWETIYNHFIANRQLKILPNNRVDLKGEPIRKTQSIGPGVVLQSATSKKDGTQLMRLPSEQHVKPLTPPTTTGICGVYVTTKDSHTLTNGPTIFIVNNVETLAKFCIQQSNIPGCVMEDIMERIEFNNKINKNIVELEKAIEQITESSGNSVSLDGKGNYQINGTKQTKTKGRDKDPNLSEQSPKKDTNDKVSKLKEYNEKLETLRNLYKIVSLNETFVPNKKLHIKKWLADSDSPASFTSDIEDSVVEQIMMLNGIEDSWKILLLLGIGVISPLPNPDYIEIMKKLAISQKLYMIIATSDYIYGTNYQFCHGYLSKDLVLTQEKIIQAIGRIGRNNVQQEYSVRFRDDSKFRQLFMPELVKPEVINMNKLFNSGVL